MTPEQMFLIGLLAFWAIIYLVARIFHLEKFGLEVKPAYLMFKSQSLRRLIEKIAGKARVFWMTLENIGLAFGVGLMVFSIYLMVNNLLLFTRPVSGAVPVFPILPGITLNLYWLPFFLISAAIIFVTHEVAHGVAAILNKISVKSTGFFLLLAIPGGFVEPDESNFENASISSKLRMLSAGSATNLMTALLVLLLLSSLFLPSSGVLVQEVLKKGPAEEAGIRQWDAIYAINGTKIVSIMDFYNYMTNVTPGQTLTLKTSGGIRFLRTVEGSNGRAIIGVILFQLDYHQSVFGLGHPIDVYLYLTLFWTQLLATSVAVINMLPIYPTDGERFLYYTVKKLIRRRQREVRIFFNAVFWGLLIANMVLTFIIYGFLSI